MKPLAVSIDLDPLACYYRIHALGPAPAPLADLILRRSLPRFLEIFAAAGVRATFFVVAQDLDGPAGGAARSLLRQAAAAGHELANHSRSHHYDLARRPRAEVADEIGRAHDAVAELGNGAPRGFRAPGYDVSAAMLDELASRGYTYDSSVFPAPGYYAAKAAVMAGLRLAGRASGAVLTDPRLLFAPAEPYRPSLGAPWRRGDAPLVELPVGVTPYLRTPVIGTNLLTAPTWLQGHWTRALAQRETFNLGLHGIDLIDAEADGIPSALVLRQPDLRTPLAHKRAALVRVLDAVTKSHTAQTLAEVAATCAV